ncbi:MAG: DNA polymerase III subunit alpha [Candidatus Algichlamydia australiensis]|nr:DNA polymerase III subunit alpha [Chlamydiales bacterium]
MSYVSLHTHSQYSILDSSASVKDLAGRAKEFGMSALALTDQGNMFGAVEFFKACKGEGIKPIIGLEIALAPRSCREKKRMPGEASGYPVLLLAKNQKGYQNLCKLSSIGFLEGFYYTPRIDWETLAAHHEGLICLSGPTYGKIASLVFQEKEEEIRPFIDLFGKDFYFELQRHEMADLTAMEEESWVVRAHREYIEKQKTLEARLLHLAKEWDVPIVATNGSHYLNADDWKAHEILMNVQSGEPCEIWEKDAMGRNRRRIPNPKRKIAPTHELYFKSPDEMAERFSDLPEAIANTQEIAEKCQFEMDFNARFYPVFVPPELEGKEISDEERKKASEEYLRRLCEEGIPHRYTEARLAKVAEKYPERDPIEVVRERLDYELEIIISKGMCDYLLIVYDFIHWAKSQKIPVGPGRGSGAGSIILYLIGITDIEPLRFNLFFERFINPERLSYPDIDVDICMDRRSEVIDYTIQKYGKEKVAQIITFGTMKAKMAVKDVGRVLSVPLTKVNEIAKLIPEDPGMTLTRALEIDADLRRMRDEDEETKRLIDLSLKLEGSIRNTGIHAAGLIICGDSLTDHIPVCTAKDADMVATQYSMKPVEAVGMLKIDFLGLKTLTSIQKAVDAVSANTGREIDWVDLPLDDTNAFSLLNQGKTMGLFQLESGGMQDLAKHLHIDKFEEIIAVGALYRPGPMEMIPSFIARKHKREPIEYDHPWMENILKETYGIMVYQEQVMQIAQHLAGYSLGEGDLLRRAMGKKDHAEMERQKVKFQEGAVEKGISKELAGAIFSKVEKFASYGFNKSHAAAYGYLSYVTAFLKASYPREWMAALMTCDVHDITKVAKHIRESESMGIPILSPDINEAGAEFAATPSGIRFAMSAIKGVGSGVVEAIVEERRENGSFESLYDCLSRIDIKRANKKAFLHLIEAGAFDFTKWSRAELRASLEPIYEMASREQKEKAKGVMDLFSTFDDQASQSFLKPPADVMPDAKSDILVKEKEIMGFYLSGHPMDEYRDLLPKLSCSPFERVKGAGHSDVFRIACIVDTVRVMISQRNQRKFAILTISDGVEHFEIPIWSDLYEVKAPLLVENQLLYAVVQVDRRDGDFRLSCRWLDDLTHVGEETIRAADAAYDQAKSNPIPDKRRPKPKEEKKEEKKNAIEIHLDADVMRLSHVLKLKQIFHEHAGGDDVQLRFFSGENRVGSIEIDEGWGVTWDPEIEKKITQLSFFQKVVQKT